MATTTNYGWTTPNDTDLVKDGAAAIRTLGSSVDTTTKNLNPSTTLGDIEYRSSTANTNTRLGIGTTGQVLTVAGGVPTWATSDDANAIQNAIVDAKGDIVAASAADTPARLAVGTDNQRLVAASGEATGLKYVSDTQNTVIDAAGDLVYGTAADTLGRLAIGTAGQVLKVNSGATAPEWGAVSSGAFTRITGGSLSGSATTFSNVFSSTYDAYQIVLSNLVGSASISLYLTLGSTATGYYGGFVGIGNNGSVSGYGMNNASSINRGIYATANGGGAIFYLINPNKTQRTFWNVAGRNTTTSSGSDGASGVGFIDDATAYTAFTLTTSSGTCTGTANIYGYTLS